jgi:hypothetical protein
LDLAAQARQASEQMRRDGVSVRFVRSIFVPEDEVCLYVFEAPSAGAATEAARRAELPFARSAEPSLNRIRGNGDEHSR